MPENRSGTYISIEHQLGALKEQERLENAWRNHDTNEYFFGESSPVQADVEPDFRAIFERVKRVAPLIPEAERRKFFKSFEYTGQIKIYHKVIFRRWKKVWNGLKDAEAFEKIMVEKRENIKTTIAPWESLPGMIKALTVAERHLEDITEQIEKNKMEAAKLKDMEQAQGKVCKEACSRFMESQKTLWGSQMPELEFYYKQMNEKLREQQASAIRRANGSHNIATGTCGQTAEKVFTTAANNQRTDSWNTRTLSNSPMAESDFPTSANGQLTFGPTIPVANALVDEGLMSLRELSEELHSFQEACGMDELEG